MAADEVSLLFQIDRVMQVRHVRNSRRPPPRCALARQPVLGRGEINHIVIPLAAKPRAQPAHRSGSPYTDIARTEALEETRMPGRGFVHGDIGENDPLTLNCAKIRLETLVGRQNLHVPTISWHLRGDLPRALHVRHHARLPRRNDEERFSTHDCLGAGRPAQCWSSFVRRAAEFSNVHNEPSETAGNFPAAAAADCAANSSAVSAQATAPSGRW